ncbi:MAG: peroxiredoxin/tetratricopeptide (TPR) repeat protein [Mariniblastus sp.]|jgi:peroxiredoxin/tetratricopeptide (TPR) repeat protein
MDWRFSISKRCLASIAIACLGSMIWETGCLAAQESAKQELKQSQEESSVANSETKAESTNSSASESKASGDSKPESASQTPPQQVVAADDSKPTSQDESQPGSASTDEKDSQPNPESDLEDSLKEILEGHSVHGEAFNGGPRQKAYLIGGTGNVQFSVTTKSTEAQAFINQGVGQLHGFWYLEAERSFRQAAALDPDCAMAYWGAAMAAHNERKRSQGFIKKAVDLIKSDEHKETFTDREKMYITSLEKYFSDKEKDKTKRALNFLKDLESIVIKYPDDLEAKAFVAHRVWHNAREGTPVSSYVALNALIEDILAVEPLHPVHHYSIHLWDHRSPELAIKGAARCGVSAPSIAHMWHMPGHIYSRLKRYEDAVYQQEASARVDHAHMMRDRVMPDEISNFAHNNEWLIRNLIFIGRAHDAVGLAKNMTELPQHPKYNTLEKRSGSASYGRRRLLQSLREFQLYDQAVELCQTSYLQTSNETEQLKTLRLMGCSAAMIGREAMVDDVKSQFDARLAEAKKSKETVDARTKELTASLDDSKDRPPRPENKKIDPKKAKLHLKESKAKSSKLKQSIALIEKAIKSVDGYVLFAAGEYQAAFEKLEKATGEDVSFLGELQFLAGDTEKGLEKIESQIKRRPKEVIPIARLAYLQYQNGDQDLAKATFEKLRSTSGSMDLDVEIFARLEPLATELGFASDWRIPHVPGIDTGFRPELDSLGPFRWSPSASPTWSLKNSNNQTVGSNDFIGQPHVVIFYLGHGCLHCAEQLQAFKPRVVDFEKAGIKMVAISTDDHDGLLKSISDAGDEMPIQLASDASLEVFKRFRAHDDFENQPLHGTFLVDGNGMIRWQDISYEPFMDHQFVLDEANRLFAEKTKVDSQAGGANSDRHVSQK